MHLTKNIEDRRPSTIETVFTEYSRERERYDTTHMSTYNIKREHKQEILESGARLRDI